MSFLTPHPRWDVPFSVTEVGGGFGRTAHAVLAVFPKCSSYTLVDTSPVLELAHSYLSRVLSSEHLRRIDFVDASTFSAGRCKVSDLAVQIDGFQEFPESVIIEYLTYFARCGFAFVSTPIGKYSAAVAGIQGHGGESRRVAMRSGRLLQIVDPWDSADLDAHRLDAIEAYRPTGMTVVASQASRLRPLYQHTLYAAQSG